MVHGIACKLQSLRELGECFEFKSAAVDAGTSLRVGSRSSWGKRPRILDHEAQARAYMHLDKDSDGAPDVAAVSRFHLLGRVRLSASFICCGTGDSSL